MLHPRLAVTLLLLLACSRQSEPSTDAPPPDLRNAEITLQVENQHWLDINIYLIRGTLTDRLGTAGSTARKVFVVPWAKVGNGTFRLGADPIGQNSGLVTETIVVRPGSVVEWTISSGLRQSNVSIF